MSVQVGSIDKLRSLQDSLAIELRTETLVRSCTSLLSLSHSMKMMWLLGDEVHLRKIRDQKVTGLTREIEDLKAQASDLMEVLRSDGNLFSVPPPVEVKTDEPMNCTD